MHKNGNLNLIQPTHAHAAQTCGPYYFLIHQGSTSHIAFSTRYGFTRWLNLHGLSLSKDLAAEGEHAMQKIQGHYYEQAVGVEEFERHKQEVDGERFYKLSNARYVEATAHRANDEQAVIITYPGSGLGEEPQTGYWKGRAIAEGMIYKNHSSEEHWLLGTPVEIVRRANTLPTQSLTDVEKAVVSRAWFDMQAAGEVDAELKDLSILRDMLVA